MKLNIIFSLALMTLLFACEKEKPVVDISLKGKWTIENSIVKEYENGIFLPPLLAENTYMFGRTSHGHFQHV